MGVDTPKESIAKEIDILERLQQANQEAAAYESQRSMSSGDSDILNSKAVFNTVRSKYGVPKEVLVAWAVNYEAARQAQVYAEAARRLLDKINALASALAALEAAEQQAVRAANTYRSRGSMSAAGPLLVTPAGTVAVVDGAAITLQAAIRSAITALAGIAASVGAGAAVGVSALFYSSTLANGELPTRYALSVPLSDLAPGVDRVELDAAAAAGAVIDMPYRLSSIAREDGRSEVLAIRTDSLTVPSAVKVVAAAYDPAQKLYTFTTATVPPRTLTWTPIVIPGDSSTASPGVLPEVSIYTGATVTPLDGRIDTFPQVHGSSFDDFIFVFPADSGLPPIYAVFQDRREEPGVVTGEGQSVSGVWLGTDTRGEGVPVPVQIADQLRGKEFRSFRAFREAFWKAVAHDPELSQEFDPGSLNLMRKGYSVYVVESEQVGMRSKYELHHKRYLSLGGEVYDVDNIYVMTPKRHVDTHRENNE